jgi:hypothetical protein
MAPAEKLKPCLTPSTSRSASETPVSAACSAYSGGARNMNANSMGSVMPVRNAVSAAENITPPTALRLSGRAVR